MLCAKCNKSEAVVHFTFCKGDRGTERIDLCEQCAPSTGFEHFTFEQFKAFSVLGKKCDFCGEAACSGQITADGGVILWCSDCGTEFARIMAELVKTERPDLVEPPLEEGAFACILDLEARAWAALATQKAVRMLKERRGRNGRHTGS